MNLPVQSAISFVLNRIKFISLFLLLLFFGRAFGQQGLSTNFSPAAVFDTVFDKDGHKYELKDLVVHQERAALLCTSGYFNVYFETGSGMEGTSATEVARRNVICQVLSDISNFITAPAGTPLATGTLKVNILVRDISSIVPTPSTSGVLGLASSFYVLPSVTTAIGGIADNEIYKTITSGYDSYTGVAAPLYSTSTSSGGSAYYHGMMAFNFSNPAINWETNMVATSTTVFDLYTVALHELTHALGNASLINDLGESKLGASYPYFSRYDSFLTNSAGTPLIVPSSAGCSLYDNIFNTTLTTSILAPGCTTGPSSGYLNNTVCSDALYYTGSVTLPLYTPICFEPPSSLSHFEDQCYPTPGAPYGNDAYFVMSNAQGLSAMKRFLKPEERMVLCDLGYKVNSTYGSAAAYGSFHNYGAGICPGTSISGINDGITATGSYAYLATVGGPAIPINNILTNDPGAATFECLQVISGGGTVSTTAGTTFNFTPAATSGITLLRYIPVSALAQRGNITYVIIYTSNAGGCTPTACNMIANGDFEQHCCAPTSFSQVTYACGWDDANGGTADFFHTTGTISTSVPCNAMGWEPDNLGLQGYAGVGHFPFGAGGEIIYSQLTSPLLPNTDYQLTLDVSLAEGYSTNAFPLQVYFQNNYVPVASMGAIPIVDPTMLFTPPAISNFNGWTPITINFTTGPISGENYIIIGDVSDLFSPAIGAGAGPGAHGCPYSYYGPINIDQSSLAF